MDRISVLGATGQLGNALVEVGPSLGFEVQGFSRQDADISNLDTVEAFLKASKPIALINTAAFHVLPLCESDPVQAFNINCIAVGGLAKLCKSLGINFVSYSTDYVFDGEKGAPYEESDRPNPLQMYGISKLAGEYSALNNYPAGAYIIRTCGVYGGPKGSRSKQGNFVLNIIKEASSKPTLEVSSDQIVSPTFAEDLAKASLMLISAQAPPGVYHLVNEGFCSWSEFTEEIFTNAIIDTDVNGVSREGLSESFRRPKFTALSNKKAKELGIVLPPWQDAVRRYIKGLKYYGKI